LAGIWFISPGPLGAAADMGADAGATVAAPVSAPFAATLSINPEAIAAIDANNSRVILSPPPSARAG
jgi:hypothetical protein